VRSRCSDVARPAWLCGAATARLGVAEAGVPGTRDGPSAGLCGFRQRSNGRCGQSTEHVKFLAGIIKHVGPATPHLTGMKGKPRA
jgi:hypothetical protein